MAYPASFRYTKQHEWTDVKGDVATIGITDYAQHELGDVVFAELPKVGAKVESGKSFGTVESVKAVSEIYSPVRARSPRSTARFTIRRRQSIAIRTPLAG